ncbi:MAG: N-acetylmuramoyl-L-alanine amidase family protein [Defluviitaleaceae bacterium]|nr:N-acetylmuramoyl-L-alanine amidase family protein [Defluviitaleaceae bacterium]
MKFAVFCLFVLIFIAPVAVFASNEPVRLVIDGTEVLDLPAPPMIVDDRTLVPVREVFERVGGIVGWHSGHRQVSLFYGDNVLVMTIDDTTANLNGNRIEMQVPPIIYNDRTMVPLRFPAEVFGFDVDWDSETRAAIVNSSRYNGNNGNNGNNQSEEDEDIELPDISNIPHIPLPPLPDMGQNNSGSSEENTSNDGLPPPGVTAATTGTNANLAQNISTATIQTISHPQTTITALQTPRETGTAAYVAVASSPISEVQYFLLPDNRLVVDIHNAVSLITGDFYVAASVPVSGVRASQFSQTPRVTRVVFDVIGAAEYSISLSADRTLLTVAFSQNRISGIFSQSDELSDSLFIQGDILPAINISTEGFPNFLTINIDNATMDAVGGTFTNGVFASHFTTGQRTDGTAYVRVYIDGDWPSFSLAQSANSVAFMMHHGVSGVRYDSVNRELRISRNFNMNINNLVRINNYLQYRYTFVLPPSAEVLGRGEISVLDGFVNSVTLARDTAGNTHLTFNTARVLTFSIHEYEDYFVIRPRLPRDVSSFIVVIDAGHGGSDPGTGHNDVVEKELVLDVAHRVVQLLDADPVITAYMTRREDTYVSLINRAEFANNLQADLFISIHANAAEFSPGVLNTEANGIETLYGISEREAAANHPINSRQLAEIMQSNLIRASGAQNRVLLNRPATVVLRETNMPSVLLELGFLTNETEAARLATPQYRQLLAQAIYEGILEAFAV